MKKIYIVCMITVCMVGILNADGVQPNGSGTEADPYQVEILDNLLWMSTQPQPLTSFFIQVVDIDASDTQNWNSGEGFIPMFLSYGSYDGQNHTIDGLYIDNDLIGGLFMIVDNSNVKNLGLTNIDYTVNGSVGGLIESSSESTIDNCYTTGSIESEGGNNGGLVANLHESQIYNCYSHCSVSGHCIAGGLIGRTEFSDIVSCYSTGDVTSITNHAGGLVGMNYDSTISDSYSSGNVTGYDYGFSNECVGGLVAYNLGTIINSYYNYEEVEINGLHLITDGALYNSMYQDWMSNDLTLDVNDYLSFNGEYYEVSTVEDFERILAFGQDQNLKFLLTDSIDLSSLPNHYIPYFSAEFNGGNNSIENLQLDTFPYMAEALFKYVNGGKIVNLNVTNAEITGQFHVSVLAGFAMNSSFRNCHCTGTILGYGSCAGLIAESIGSTIEFCSSDVDLHGDPDFPYPSGFAGLVFFTSDETLISNCYSSGSIQAYSGLYGLVHTNYQSTISNCYSVCSMSSEESEFDRGLVWDNDEGIVENSFWDTDVTGVSLSYGGTGKTTQEMKDVATYTSLATQGLDTPWDFMGNPFDDIGDDDFWDIDASYNNGYPFIVRDMVHAEPVVTIPGCQLSNHPNPFNPTTEICFSLTSEQYEQDEPVAIEIFNIRGQKVKTISIDINEMSSRPSGARGDISSSTTWDGTDSDNRRVASGMYFYQLKVNSKSVAQRKMMLLK